MRRRLLRRVLLASLAAFSSVPAAAGPIVAVGEFYFQRDEFFEYFILDNNSGLPGLTFSAIIQLDNSDYADQFDPAPIASGGSAISSGLFPITPFAGGGQVSLVFTIENGVLFPGTLSLSNLLYDDFDGDADYSPSFSAVVNYTEDTTVAVTEAPSWLVAVIGVSALAAGRALFS